MFDTGAVLSFLAVGALMEGSKLAARWNRRIDERSTVEDGRVTRARVTGLGRWRALAGEGLAALRRRAVEWYATTLVIWCATTPLVVSQFHLLSGAGLLVNVILSPVTG